MVAIVYQKHRKKSILSWDGRPKAACKITVYRAKAFPWGKVGLQTAARMRANQEVRKRQHFCRNGVLDSPHQSQQSVAKSRLLRQLLPREALGRSRATATNKSLNYNLLLCAHHLILRYPLGQLAAEEDAVLIAPGADHFQTLHAIA